MPTLRITVFAVLISLIPPSASADPDSRVRSSHARLAALLTEGQLRSATFRQLTARLQISDLIVHVEAAPVGHPLDGGLQFVSATPLRRYLRITVRTDLPASQLVSLLGHELMHAVEVADRPEVRDEDSFRQLYESIGQPGPRGARVTYDTRAAVEAGTKVALELRSTTALSWRTRRRDDQRGNTAHPAR